MGHLFWSVDVDQERTWLMIYQYELLCNSELYDKKIVVDGCVQNLVHKILVMLFLDWGNWLVSTTVYF